MKVKLILFLIFTITYLIGQDFQDIDFDSEVTKVQPMTGIVFWPGNNNIATDAISLEFSYMDFSQIMTGKDEYDWTVVEDLLDAMASRNHQAVLRFRYSYPGRTTTVPQYIKDLPDYEETEGLSEGKTTWFPDWRHEELRRFTLEFYKEYASRYDDDPRLAFVQVGFGLWAEYHIYSGPFELGRTFPSKEFQKTFFDHLDEVFKETYWSISIDAASAVYSPFENDPTYKDINFGVFDDSFMHGGHSGYNTTSWNFFDRERYRIAPAGGEFSYYSDYDQQNVLNPDIGAYGLPYEIFAQNFHMTYINGNDQNSYHSLDRIKEASLASGYIFKLNSIKTTSDSSIIEVINLGVAPIYVDAFLTVNGVRCKESLKLLAPDEPKLFHISSGGTEPVITIESDEILETEEIQFYGTVNEYKRYEQPSSVNNSGALTKLIKVYPNFIDSGFVNFEYFGNETLNAKIFSHNGNHIISKQFSQNVKLNLSSLPKGVYYIAFLNKNQIVQTEKIILY